MLGFSLPGTCLGQGYGSADSSGTKPTQDTMYRLYSTTKTFTAMLAYIARDQGRLSLDDTVASRVPGFEMLSPYVPTNRGITFRQLGRHLSGLPREPPCMQFVAGDDPHHFNCQNVTTAEILARLSGVAQKLRTDVLPQYSNLGFSLLGHAAAGQLKDRWMSYRDAVRGAILEPLQMNRTGFEITPEIRAGMATGHSAGVEDTLDYYDIGWAAPAGQMYSSTRDLGKLVKMFFRDTAKGDIGAGQPLDGATIREMMRPQIINADFNGGGATGTTGYGIPWEIRFQESNGYWEYTKGGGGPGYVAWIVMIPELKLGATVLVSTSDLSVAETVFPSLDEVVPPLVDYLRAAEQATNSTGFLPPNYKDIVGTYTILERDSPWGAEAHHHVTLASEADPHLVFDGKDALAYVPALSNATTVVLRMYPTDDTGPCNSIETGFYYGFVYWHARGGNGDRAWVEQPGMYYGPRFTKSDTASSLPVRSSPQRLLFP